MTARICFRADASTTIGQGHVMRCLALAHTLRDAGWHCTFLCQERTGHPIDLLRMQGFSVAALPATDDWHDDAQATLAALDQQPIDWLVVDHYGLDERWERQLRHRVKHLLVIDDLANRKHDCDLLLDQNAGRQASDYQSLVPPDCSVLLGPEFALLREEFRQQRINNPARTNDRNIGHLLISMGGADAGNVTGKVLQVLAEQPPATLKTVTVVLGSACPWINDIRAFAGEFPRPIRLIINAQNMAALMAEADLAIGAGGISAWERCCLGLPSLIIAIAENQLPGALALQALGAAQFLGDADTFAPALKRIFTKGLSAEHLHALSVNAYRMVDGNGRLRVLQAMQIDTGTAAAPTALLQASLRVMSEKDLPMVLSWRNHPQVREFMRNNHEISMAEHANWFTLKSAQDELPYLFELDGQAMGFVQFEPAGIEDTVEWGFYLAPEAPKGSARLLGQVAIRHAFERQHLTRLIGRVMPTNLPSIRFHERLGFTHDDLSENSGDTHEATLLQFSLSRQDWIPNHEFGGSHAHHS